MKEKNNKILIICISVMAVIICALCIVIFVMKSNNNTNNNNGNNTNVPETPNNTEIEEPQADIMDYIEDMAFDVPSRAELRIELEGNYYPKEQIEEALSKATIDWNEKAEQYIVNITEESLFSKQEIIDMMKEEEFTDTEINNAIKSLGKKLDFNKNALGLVKDKECELYSKSQLQKLLKDHKFTTSEIDYAIKKLNANYYDRAVDLAKKVHLTVKKNDIEKYLKDQGFTEKEATINLDWIYQVNYGIYYEMSSNNYNYGIGDMIEIGGEDFYVIDSNSEETKLFAANDLYVDSAYQDDVRYCTQTISPSSAGYENPGEVVFASVAYWTDSKDKLVSEFGSDYPAYVYNTRSNAYKYVEKYVSLLNNLGLFSTIKGKLISYEELMKAGCKKEDLSITCPFFLSDRGTGNSNYLTGSANNKNGIYHVWTDQLRESYSLCSDCVNTNSGKVRPVITVKTSELNNYYKEYKIKGTYR